MKKIISLFLATVVAAVLPFTCSAEYSHNSAYDGIYWNVTNDVSYIEIQPKKCYAMVVFSDVENTYIKASTNVFNIDTKKFNASFTGFVIVNKSGNYVSRSPADTYLSGTVERTNSSITIKTGSRYYEKK